MTGLLDYWTVPLEYWMGILDWTTGLLDWTTGLLDWTTGLLDGPLNTGWEYLTGLLDYKISVCSFTISKITCRFYLLYPNRNNTRLDEGIRNILLYM